MKIMEILKKTQDELIDYVCKELKANRYKKIKRTKDYVYAKGNIPVLLVAHLDIVHREAPNLILHDTKNQMLWSPTGIGGDDRCRSICNIKYH